MLQEMIFNAGVIIFYLLGDIFISIYSTGCYNMIAYKAGAVSIAVLLFYVSKQKFCNLLSV